MAHALVTKVELQGRTLEEGQQMLEEQVIPVVKGLPGFERGLWLRAGDGSSGMGILVFDSEEHATAARDGLGENRPADAPPITSTEVFNVAGQA